jgi:hypothetical protein
LSCSRIAARRWESGSEGAVAISENRSSAGRYGDTATLGRANTGGGGVALFGLCSVIWAATGASGMFWPIWVALVVVIFVGRNAWRLYGPAPELDRVEEELAARRRRDSRRDRHDYRRDRRDRRRRY